MSMNQSYQVQDDPQLLKDMMTDLETADPLYSPTNYWKYYEKFFMPDLEKYGLNNFRRRRRSILSSFGASDLRIRGRFGFRRRPDERPQFSRITSIGNLILEFLERFRFQVFPDVIGDPDEITHYFHRYVKNKFEAKGLDLARCPASRWGNPEDLVWIEGAPWTLRHLQYCSMLVDALKTLPMGGRDVLCELGAGMGRNIETTAHLFDKMTFLVFDIPPQLYVAGQYLKKVFRERVVSYREAIALDPSGWKKVPEEIQGKIIILPSWKMPAWSAVTIQVFWNSASFQEMEPNVVLNYLEIVKRMKPQWIYINALPGGNYWGTWQPGKGGTREPVREDYYFESLNDLYQLEACFPTDYFLRNNGYLSYIFRSAKDRRIDS